MGTIKGSYQYRTLELDRAAINTEERTIPASLSSESPVKRFFGTETLSHEPGSVDLTRADGGLPMLFNHNTDSPIGLVENVRLEGSRLRGVLRFSRNEKALEVWRDVQDGFLRDMSIGYSITDYEERADDQVLVTGWSINEASVVPVAADTAVGINRSIGDSKMSDETGKTGTGDTGNTGGTFEQDYERSIELGTERGIAEERKRIADIESTFARHLERPGIAALKADCVTAGDTLERSQSRLLNALSSNIEPINPVYSQDERSGSAGTTASVFAGRDQQEKVVAGIRAAVEHRMGIKDEKRDISGNPYVSMSMLEHARALSRNPRAFDGMSKMEMAGAVFRDYTEVAYTDTTATYPKILLDAANKTLLAAYMESNQSWRTWCDTGSVPDFKTINLPQRHSFPTIEGVAENGEFANYSFTESAETAQASVKGGIWSVTRQTLVNDDLGAFSEVGGALGEAASRAVCDDVYAKLLTVHTMDDDSNPLFDAANHSNVYGAATISVDTVDDVRVGMATQTDKTGNTIGIRPQYLICPVAYEGTASTLRNSQFDPDTGNGDTNRVNWVAGTFEVIAEHRIDADATNPTNWFMAGPKGRTIRVYFLNGVETPYLERRDGFRIDGMEMKVRLDYGVAVLDYRGLALTGTAPV
jgi:HK97 family phage prohead protease